MKSLILNILINISILISFNYTIYGAVPANPIVLEADHIINCQVQNNSYGADDFGVINDIPTPPTWVIPRENGTAILGLIEAYIETGDIRYKDAALYAAQYLENRQESDGAWCFHYDEKFDTIVDKNKSPSTAGSVIMGFYRIWKMGWDSTGQYYDNAKLAAQYILQCIQNKPGTANGLAGSGKEYGTGYPYSDSLGDYRWSSWSWVSDNCYAYIALMCVRAWAATRGETSFADECYNAAIGILSGINTYLKNPTNAVWYRVVDGNGNPVADSTVRDQLCYYPQKYDLPVTNYGSPAIAAWMTNNLQVNSGTISQGYGSYIWTPDNNDEGNRRSQGYAEEAWLALVDIPSKTATNSRNRAKTWWEADDNTGGSGQLWNITAGGIVGWYDPDTGQTAGSLERFIDTSANCIFVYRGGYNHNLSSIDDAVDHFIVTTTSTGVVAERAFKLRVKAVNANNAPVFYKGTITFTASTDRVNLPADYTFVDADAGEHIFDVTATNLGYLTITVKSTTNTNIKGSVTVYVYPPSTEYYVATWGNDANPGTFTQPFRTLAHAADIIAAGDTVYVFGGTFDVAGTDVTAYIDTPGLPDAWIVFKPYTNDVNLNGNGSPVIEITNSAYVRIEGFNIWNCSPHGILVMKSPDVVLTNNEVSACANYGISVYKSDNVTVVSNKVHDNGWGSTVEGPSGILFNNSSGGKILFNKSWTNYWHGIRLEYGSDNALVYGNETWKNDKNGIIVVNGCNNVSVKSNLSYRSINENEIFIYASQNIYVEKNKTHHAYWNGIQVQGGSWNVYVKNNESYSNRDGGICTWENVGYVEIVSNKCYDNNGGGDQDGIRLILSGNIIVKGNECYGNPSNGVNVDSARGLPIIIRENILYRNGDIAALEENGIQVNDWWGQNNGVPGCSNVYIINNTIYSNAGNNIDIRASGSTTKNIYIISNDIYGAQYGTSNTESASIYIDTGVGRCIISHNTIYNNAGAAISLRVGDQTINGNIIYKNGGGAELGAIVFWGGSNFYLTNNVIFKSAQDGINSAGASVADENIVNCTIVSNGGTGIILNGGLVKNTIAAWNQSGTEISGAGTVSYNDEFPGTGQGGIGSISQNPQFLSMDPNSSNFMRLDPSVPSPCIDAGDPNDPVPPGGEPRIDMGAFEVIKDVTADHFEIVHGTNATVGVWTNVTITAKSNNFIDWNYTGTITVYILNGTESMIGWQNVDGQGTFTPNITNASSFVYTFSPDDNGSVTFKIIDNTEESIDIEVKSGSIIDDDTEGYLKFWWGDLHVSSYFPSDGAQNIDLNANIYIYFNNELDASTVNSNTVYLLDSDWNKVAVSNSVVSNSITLIPKSDLKPNEFYTVIVTTNIYDTQIPPTNLSSETQWNFYTAPGNETFHRYHTITIGNNSGWSNSINITYDNSSGELIANDTGNSGADPYQLWVTWDTNNLYLRILRTSKSSVEWCDYLAIDTTRDDQGASDMPSITIGGQTPTRNFVNNRKPEHLLVFGHEDGAGPGGVDWVADSAAAGVFFYRYQYVDGMWGSAIDISPNVGYDSVSGDGDDFIEIELPWSTFGGVPNRIALSLYTRDLDSSVDYYCPDASSSESNWVTFDPDNNGDDIPDGYSVPPTVDHFEIIHDGYGTVNVYEPVVIKAITSGGEVLQNYTGTITLYAAPGYTGTIIWSTNTNGNYGTFVNLGGGKATYTFSTNDYGIVTLMVVDNTAESIDPEVKDDAGHYDNDTPPQYLVFQSTITSAPSIVLKKSISNVTLNGSIEDTIPGATILYKIFYSNKGPGNLDNIIIYDNIPTFGIYVSNSSSAPSGWTNQYSTNTNPDQSYNSTDYTTTQPPVAQIKWLRWKKPSMLENESGVITFRLIIK